MAELPTVLERPGQGYTNEDETEATRSGTLNSSIYARRCNYTAVQKQKTLV